MKRKKKDKKIGRFALGLLEFVVVLACLAYICSMIFWINPPLSGILVVGAILLFLAYTLAREGIRNIVGERPDSPDGSGNGGRKWWPIRFFIFIGPILYGVSATIIQWPFVKKRAWQEAPRHQASSGGIIYQPNGAFLPGGPSNQHMEGRGYEKGNNINKRRNHVVSRCYTVLSAVVLLWTGYLLHGFCLYGRPMAGYCNGLFCFAVSCGGGDLFEQGLLRDSGNETHMVMVYWGISYRSGIPFFPVVSS